MTFATLLVAATLSQVCPEPPARGGPPPCAAANVPGCLPGYHRVVDAYGRARYVCDARQPAPPPAVAAPAPAPGYAPPPAPGYAPPPAPTYVPPPPRSGYYGVPYAATRGIFGLVLMPGVVSSLTRPREGEGAGALGIELRPLYGGGRLRLGVEGGSFGRIAELGVKYDFLDPGPIRPFLALGVGGAAIDPDPTWRFEGSVAAGIDLYASRDFFFTLELKERFFAERSADAYYGLDAGHLHQTAFFFGVGLYL